MIKLKNLKLSHNLKSGLLSLFIGFFCFSCNPPVGPTTPAPAPEQERNNSVRVLLTETEQKRADEIRGRSSRPRCSTRDQNSRKLSIKADNDNFISSNNIAQYELSGRCEINDRPVQISVNGYPISENPSCDKKTLEGGNGFKCGRSI